MRLRSLSRFTVAAITVPAIALGAAACSSSGGSSSGSDTGSGGSGTTLTYWASNQGPVLDKDKEVLTPVLAKFTQQTGIKVNLEVIGWNDLQTRIQTAITSSSGPDVLNIGNTWAASLQATGAFMPYDAAAFTAIGGKDKFVKPALDDRRRPWSGPDLGPAISAWPTASTTTSDVHRRRHPAADHLGGDGRRGPEADQHGQEHYGIALAAGSYTENVHFAFINGSAERRRLVRQRRQADVHQ